MILYLLILQIITFIVLILVLRQLFYKQLNESLLRLQALHKLNLARERELKVQAEAADLEREEKMKLAQAEGDRIITEATAAAEKVTAGVEQHARERAAKIVERTQSDLDRKARDFMAEQHQQSVGLALSMVKLAFSPKGQEVLQDHLLEELIAGTREMDQDIFKSSLKDRVQVVAAHPLTDQRRGDLVRILSEKMGFTIDIEFKEDPQIIAGLVINIGSLVIDGSLRNKLEKAAQHLKK